MKKIKELYIGSVGYPDGKGGYLELKSLEGIEFAVNLERFKVDMIRYDTKNTKLWLMVRGKISKRCDMKATYF